MKKVFLLFLVAGLIISIQAQDTDYLQDFEFVVTRVKKDYPGYLDKVNENNISQIEDLESDLRKKLHQFPDSCVYYLKAYTDWFKDHHLRISQNNLPKIKGKGQEIEKKYGSFDFDELFSRTESIEGIWRGYRGNFAITKDNGKNYVGIAIEFPGYEKNQIMFEAIDLGNNEFDLISYRDYRHYQPENEKGSLHQNQSVFEIHDDTRFVRQSEDLKADLSFFLSYIPQYPNGLNTYSVAQNLSDSTFYLRIPGFYSSLANDLVLKHWDEIIARPNLIIDIRNNGGGQDEYYEELAGLIYTNPYENKGVEWYSTGGIVADWEASIKNGEIKEGYEESSIALLESMKKNIGGFVLNPNYDNEELMVRDTIYQYPKKVGIIINGRNASSAEQFLLTAKQSAKVTLFGNENSAGVLDYSNCTQKKSPSGKYNLYLPATRSRRLPENPIDNIGIAPDIIIPLEPKEQLFNRLDDWVYFVKYYLE